MANERLFDAFPPETWEQWEAVVRKELKDREPSALDIALGSAVLKPYHIDHGPVVGDQRRGSKRDGNKWRSTIAVDASCLLYTSRCV